MVCLCINRKKSSPELSICWSDLSVSFSLQTYQFQETNHTIHTHIFHDINTTKTLEPTTPNTIKNYRKQKTAKHSYNI